VLNGFGFDVDASTQRRALISPEQKRAYALLRASLGGSVVELDDRAAAPVTRGVVDAVWRPRSDGDERTSVSHFLDWYAAALGAGSIGELSSVQPEMSDEQRAALKRYLGYARSVRVSFSDVDLIVDGNRAVVSAWRRDTIEPDDTGPVQLEVRVDLLLERWGAGWFIHDQQRASQRRQQMRRRIERQVLPSRPTGVGAWMSEIRMHVPGWLPTGPPALIAPASSTVFVEDFEPGSGRKWEALGAANVTVVSYQGGNGGGGHALRLESGTVTIPLGQGTTVVDAETVRLVVRAEDVGAGMEVMFPTKGRPARFSSHASVSPGEWQAIELPLRFFRWNPPSVPTWEDVDRLVLTHTGGGAVLVDRIELVRGRIPRAAYLTPHEIESIAFEDSTTTAPVRGLKGNLPWVILTDAPALEARKLLDALDATYESVRRDLPSLLPPSRPVVLLVFANQDSYQRFWPRFQRHFGLDYVPRGEGGMAAMGIGATWYRDAWRGDPTGMLDMCVHEAVHALMVQMLGLTGGQTWLSEGLAERYGRKAAGLDAAVYVQRDLGAAVPPLASLLNGTPTGYAGYIPAALVIEWLMADPLRRTQLSALLRDMRDHATVDINALAADHFGMSMATFDASWREWIRSRYGALWQPRLPDKRE